MVYKEISTKDKDGNSWQLCLTQDPKKTNRFIFSFFFNGREFCLSKIQNKRTADMTWELLDQLSKRGSTIDLKQKDESKPDQNPKESPKPKKRPSATKQEPAKEVQSNRPKKRVKKRPV